MLLVCLLFLGLVVVFVSLRIGDNGWQHCPGQHVVKCGAMGAWLAMHVESIFPPPAAHPPFSFIVHFVLAIIHTLFEPIPLKICMSWFLDLTMWHVIIKYLCFGLFWLCRRQARGPCPRRSGHATQCKDQFSMYVFPFFLIVLTILAFLAIWT
jgi:small-conductance mechanosensitive channel